MCTHVSLRTFTHRTVMPCIALWSHSLHISLLYISCYAGIAIPWAMGAPSRSSCWLTIAPHIWLHPSACLGSQAAYLATSFPMCWSFSFSPTAPPRCNLWLQVVFNPPRLFIPQAAHELGSWPTQWQKRQQHAWAPMHFKVNFGPFNHHASYNSKMIILPNYVHACCLIAFVGKAWNGSWLPLKVYLQTLWGIVGSLARSWHYIRCKI